MKNQKSAKVILFGVLLALVVGTSFIEFGKANPYLYHEIVNPPRDAEPPVISIMPLENNTMISSKSVSLNVSMTVKESNYYQYFTETRYQTDWKGNYSRFYYYSYSSGRLYRDLFYSLNFTDIPEGFHNITFVAWAHGGWAEGLAAKAFTTRSVSMIYFTVDTISPNISFLSSENRNCENSEFALNFSVNEPVSNISYVLDGQKNKTIGGNVTLTGLPIGAHNVTVYAWDAAGNVGSSENAIFTVIEPELPEAFPVLPVVAISGTVAAVLACLSLLLFKRISKKERTSA